MTKVRKSVMIVEDYGILARSIAEELKNWGFEITGIYKSKHEAIAALESKNIPDIALIDICLDGPIEHNEDGIDLGEFINKHYNFPIIYVTGSLDKINRNRINTDHVFDKLTVQNEELPLALVKEIYSFYENGSKSIKKRLDDSFFITPDSKSGTRTRIRIKYDELLYVSSSAGLSTFHLIEKNNKRTELLTITLTLLLKQLNDQRFVQINRSQIINIDKIQAFNSKEIHLEDGTILGCTRKEAIDTIINNTNIIFTKIKKID